MPQTTIDPNALRSLLAQAGAPGPAPTSPGMEQPAVPPTAHGIAEGPYLPMHQSPEMRSINEQRAQIQGSLPLPPGTSEGQLPQALMRAQLIQRFYGKQDLPGYERREPDADNFWTDLIGHALRFQDTFPTHTGINPVQNLLSYIQQDINPAWPGWQAITQFLRRLPSQYHPENIPNTRGIEGQM